VPGRLASTCQNCLVNCVNPIITADSSTAAPFRLSLSLGRWARGLRAAAGSLRDMDWFGTERARIYAVAMVIVWVGVFIKIFWLLHSGQDTQGVPFGSDYSSFWAASRLVLAGLPSDVYVVSMHHLAELPVLTQGYEAFYYPPPYLVLCIPLALLPFYPSLAVFLCSTGAVFIYTIGRIIRTPWAVAAIVAFPAVPMNVIAGQNAFLTAAILGSGLTILGRRPKLSGAILGLIVIKPHLAFAIPIALVISRRWTTLGWAAASALGLVALSYALFGGDVWTAFIANAHNSRETLEQGIVGFTKMQSAFAFARSVGVGIIPAYAVQGIVAALAVYILIMARCRGVSAAMERSLIVVASLLMTPFLLFYDMLILIVPLAWMLREWTDRGFPPWSKLVLLLTFCAPIASWLTLAPRPFGLPAMLLFGGYLWWSSVRPLGSAASAGGACGVALKPI
jgi:hypothetical protein